MGRRPRDAESGLARRPAIRDAAIVFDTQPARTLTFQTGERIELQAICLGTGLEGPMRCYLCETEINGQSSHFSAMPYRCSRCGNLTVTDDAQMALQDYRKTYPVSKIDAISHFVRQISESNPTKHVAVNFHNLQTWFNDPTITLKKVGEQVRYLLLWLSTAATKEGNPAKNRKSVCW